MIQDNSAKVIIIGDSGVGKTSLVESQVTGDFDVSVPPTVAVATVKTSIQLKDETVDIKIWDTAGQEQYSSLIPMFSRDSMVCIIVCDISKPDTIAHIDKWVSILDETEGARPAIVIAVNKIDLENQVEKTRDDIFQELAPKYTNIIFVSALTGENVQELFIVVAKEAAEALRARPLDTCERPSLRRQPERPCKC